MKTINQISKYASISKKALYHYEKIGLLSPTRADNGYRYYDDNDINKLKQIMLFKEMDFSLSEMANFFDADNFDIKRALKLHKQVLIAKKNRLDKIIDLVDSEIKGENIMSFNEFDMTEIEKAKEKYGQEANSKWGETNTYKQSQKKTSKYSKDDWKKIQSEADDIFSSFSNLSDAKSSEAKALVLEWKNHITKNYYDCTNEILLGLADMYVMDERFLNNIDKYKKGTAQMMSDAIKYHCK